MQVKILLLCFAGFAYGLLSAAGVFTVFVAVGLVPRFAGKTHTAKYILLYEEAVVFGTFFGGYLSVFGKYALLGKGLQKLFVTRSFIPLLLGNIFQGIFGLFSGMFVGCLALAIAEILDSLPTFARRIDFRKGVGLTVLAMAAGKLMGALFYLDLLRGNN